MLPILQNNNAITRMSLKELTDLIGVRHDKACQKVLSMAEEPEFGTVSIMDIVYNDKGQTIQTYMLDRRQSIAVASRLNTALLMRVIDRWQELENKQPENPLLQLANAVITAQAIIQDQFTKLEQQKPAVEFVERYVQSRGNIGFRQVAKLLNIKENDFRTFLEDNQIMYKLGGEWVPYAPHLNAGRFVMKTGTTDNDHTFNSAKFTPKGVEWIALQWQRYDSRRLSGIKAINNLTTLLQ